MAATYRLGAVRRALDHAVEVLGRLRTTPAPRAEDGDQGTRTPRPEPGSERLLWLFTLVGLVGIGVSVVVAALAGPRVTRVVAVTATQAMVLGSLFVLVWRLTGLLEEARARLEATSTTDTLTGLANRRYLLRRAEEECARIGRNRERGGVRSGVGFVLVDVDHFRRVNETHGHAAGDAALQELAQLLRASTRPYDVVGRSAGEEFLLLLPHADYQESEQVAERVWARVRQASFSATGGSPGLTVSVGVACATVGAESATAALRRAEERLQRAKAAGGDRVVAV